MVAADGAGQEHDGDVGEQHKGHRAGEPATVAGPDEHPVDDEDVAGQRLAQGDDDQTRSDRAAHGGIVGEERGQDPVQREQPEPEDDASPDAPPDHERRRGASTGRVTAAELGASEGLTGDGEGVEGEDE